MPRVSNYKHRGDKQSLLRLSLKFQNLIKYINTRTELPQNGIFLRNGMRSPEFFFIFTYIELKHTKFVHTTP